MKRKQAVLKYNSSERGKKNKRAESKRRRQEAKAKGLCQRCLVNKAEKSKCSLCAARDVRNQRLRRRTLSIEKCDAKIEELLNAYPFLKEVISGI